MVRAYKAPTDPRGGHVRLYWDIYDSNAWKCLGSSDQIAYMALLRQKGSTNNGDISLPITLAARCGISSRTTLAKSLRALCAVGLIAVTREGGSTKGGQRLPTLYRFTDHEVFAHPVKHIDATKATNEWKDIKTLGLGREAIRVAEANAAAKALKEKTKTHVHFLDVTSPKNGLVEPKTSPKNGLWSAGPVQKMDMAKA
jgi:hypothetical protein